MLDTTIRVIFKTLKELLTGIYQDVRQQFYQKSDKGYGEPQCR